MLYPLKFRPRLKERIWGGRRLSDKLGKRLPKERPIGESWEISGLDGDLSVVSNGMLAGNNIEELIEVYMGELVGDRVYEKFGLQFPLLIKYIDAHDKLSVQVHPDDELAGKRHEGYGKSEMWYVVDCDPGSELYLGFDGAVTPESYRERVAQGTLPDVLSHIKVHPGDAFFIPAGTVHAIGGGVLVAEIQQASDITYRIYDWGRTDASGKSRELHTDLAADAIRFDNGDPYRVTASPRKNEAVALKKSPYFTINLLEVDGTAERLHVERDSFVVYMLLDGKVTLGWAEGTETVKKGETLLVPACIEEVTLAGQGKLLEIYIE